MLFRSCTLVNLLASSSARGQAGRIDTTFSPDIPTNANVWSLLVQPDGRILAAGTSPNAGQAPIWRLNPDGTRDKSFAPGTGPNGMVMALAMQPDGRILVAGAFSEVSGVRRSQVARLNQDGSVDPSFGSDGSGPTSNFTRAIAIQGDGRILLGGAFNAVSGVSRPGVARLLENGALDTGFDPGGPQSFGVQGVAVLPGGKITFYTGIIRKLNLKVE